jgi:putative DNA primase/helicase
MRQRVSYIAQTSSGGRSKRVWPHEARVLPDSNAYGPPAPPDFPVRAVSVDVGLGKTRTWRERVAPALVGGAFAGVLAVPRHRLGDEIVRDLAEAGITAGVYRGREAVDPTQPGEKMCRELDRTTMIRDALNSVAPHACKYKGAECGAYRLCGYQRQRTANPDIWIVPHQLLFRVRPSFIPQPDSLTIDEAFWSAALHGVDWPYELRLSAVAEHRDICFPGPFGSVRDAGATADLMEISCRVHRALQREEVGRIRRAALTEAGITSADLRDARRLEWRRKIEAEVRPGMALPLVREICMGITVHNQALARLARFWELLLRTIEGPCERSPWLDLRKAQSPGGEETAPVIVMIWRDDIHPSWAAPTLIMDATMPVEIVRQFFTNLAYPQRIAAPMPCTRVRQITDRPMTADMLIPKKTANVRTNTTRRANAERVRRFLEMRAYEASPGEVLVVCQLGLERALIAGALPPNVRIRHFNDIVGENAWSDVALVIVIGRTEPAPGIVERIARALFGADVAEVEPDAEGHARYPLITRGVRMRDGRGVQVLGSQHPDERAEVVRWAICETGVIQAIGRGRGVNRSTENPLQIDILTNIVLPIEVDEVTTWDRIQPSLAQIMRARGAVPLSYCDMATAYPDLFVSRDAAKMALTRENPEQMPVEKYLIGVCSGFLAISYRRGGARGPAGKLLYDGMRIEPLAWLTDRVGDVVVG